LDSLLKLLYTHPLQLTKYVRQISIPLSKVREFEVATPRFPKPSFTGDPSPLWAAQKLRSLLSSYRKLLSPKQWKAFLHKTPSADYYGSESTRAEPEVNLELLEAAVTGVRTAVAECRYQFRNERWNCSQITDTDNSNNALFGNVLMKGIPETAFVYSLVSAGLVRGVAEACLTNIRNCPCNNRGRTETEAGWQWEGCDHNIHYGRRFTRNLLDQMENGFHIRFLMNLHNYRVGRRVVSQNMQRYCRCHGTSGSCTMKTCYRQTPTMRTIGNQLKLMYQEASQVIRDNTIPDSWGQNSRPTDIGGPVIQLNRWNPRRQREVSSNPPLYWSPQRHRQRYPRPSLIKVKHTTASSPSSHVFPRSPRDLRPSTQELVYFERPPEDLFCNANPHLHLTGTFDRECNSSVTGPQNCRSLCCGRGFRTQHYYSLENCDCKFFWCCRVECRKCLVLKKVETCL
uniref:Protein Wnt n=1 Tax=Schistocephalus solidus TaxID=70667 RepID=A0A183T256_SCHSO